MHLNIKAKKRFGQNFLIDESIKNKIIQSMPNIKNERVVEIGPGLGDLTKKLLAKHSVTAYEVDSDLCGHLKNVFMKEIQSGTFDLIEGDVLEFWNRNKTLFKSKYFLIANIPYYITTPIIENALNDKNCEIMVVMVQKEFAKKLTAQEKNSDSSFISNLAKIVSKVEILFDIPPESFKPQPKVYSSVVYIEKTALSYEIDFDKLKKFLKKSFANPRKTLQKNLANTYEKKLVNEVLLKLNINSNIRPHELSFEDHFHLYKILTQTK